MDWRALVMDKVVTFSRSVAEDLDWDNGAVGGFNSQRGKMWAGEGGSLQELLGSIFPEDK